MEASHHIEGRIFDDLHFQISRRRSFLIGLCSQEIKGLPNFYGTHHIGASTEQAQLAVAQEVVRIVREFKDNGNVLNCVNA